MSLPEIIERAWRTWRWLWYEIRHPMLDCDGRRLIGLYLLLVGLTRLVFIPIVTLDFASDHVYGIAAIVIGSGLLATTWGERAFTIAGRLIALAGAAVCCAWAFDLTYRATGFWSMLIFGYVLLREVVRA